MLLIYYYHITTLLNPIYSKYSRTCRNSTQNTIENYHENLTTRFDSAAAMFVITDSRWQIVHSITSNHDTFIFLHLIYFEMFCAHYSEYYFQYYYWIIISKIRILYLVIHNWYSVTTYPPWGRCTAQHSNQWTLRLNFMFPLQ